MSARVRLALLLGLRASAEFLGAEPSSVCVRVPLSELRVTALLSESQVLTEKLSVNEVLSTLEHNLKEGGMGVAWTHLFGSISSPTGYSWRTRTKASHV